MKTINLINILPIVIFSLVGCGQSKQNGPSSNDQMQELRQITEKQSAHIEEIETHLNALEVRLQTVELKLRAAEVQVPRKTPIGASETHKFLKDKYYVFDKPLPLPTVNRVDTLVEPEGTLVLSSGHVFHIKDIAIFNNRAVYYVQFKCSDTNATIDLGWQQHMVLASNLESDLTGGNVRLATREEIDAFNRR